MHPTIKQAITAVARTANSLKAGDIASLCWFGKCWYQYSKLAGKSPSLLDLYPILRDRRESAGFAKGHYYFQDLWAAQLVFRFKCKEHVDVGSRIDGFVAHCASFVPVVYVDIRPLESGFESIKWIKGDILSLPFPNASVQSLSCLHVAEHVGLGRYGDSLDPKGTWRAIAELQRVLAPGGNLYFSLPVGRERVCFNAHRVLNPHRIVEAFDNLALVSFAAISDQGKLNLFARLEDVENSEYACGLFHFRAMSAR